MPDLAGRTALVTGTAHGIGAAIAEALERCGATVHGVDRDSVDVADGEQVAELVPGSAGSTSSSTTRAESSARWAGRWRTSRTTTGAPWSTRTSRHVRLHARIRSGDEGGGVRPHREHLVRRRPQRSLTGIQAYASAKAGQIGFTRQTARELGPFGITVNCIAPGFVLSNPTSIRQWESYGEDGQRAMLEQIATRRLGKPEDIANGVLFFVAEEASWVTGQVISIDGGHSIF